MTALKGALVTLEGCEGCGKSTQAAMLADRLRGLVGEVVEVREPGGTVVGDGLRELLLRPDHGPVDPMAELFMYEAARAQLVAERIRPSIERGAIVVCDRFYDSTTAYQAYARGLDAGVVAELNRLASRGVAPAATVVLDIDPAQGLSRATGKGADRLESEGAAFHQRVRDGFLALAAEEPGRVAVVPAEGSPEEVAEAVWAQVSSRLRAAGVLP